MTALLDRIVANWKTTAGGVLTVAGIVFASLTSNGSTQHWVLVASAIVGGLTAALAKDK